jgi:bifunctional non-homologous end joining protein LigD
MKSIILEYSDLGVGGSSHKEYRIHLQKAQDGYSITFEFGRLGSTLQTGSKAQSVPLDEAEHIFDRLVADKMRNGYQPVKNGSAQAPVPVPIAALGARTPFPAELLEEITEEQLATYMEREDYWIELKANGQRRQVQKLGPGKYTGFNKLGTSVALPAPLVNDLERFDAKTFFIDGELIGDDLIVYDLLEINGKNISMLPYRDRCEHRAKLIPRKQQRSHVEIISTWKTKMQKRIGFRSVQEARAEGIVAKFIHAVYQGGRRGDHKKFKFTKMATFKVIRVGDKGHNSATVALLDNGKWREMGRASLIGKDKRICTGSLVEIRFLYVQGENGRLYQPRIIGLRTDVNESECTMAQLKVAYKGAVS